MIKAVLLDLDNTLIRNPDKAFAREFLTQFDEHFASTLNLDDASTRLRRAIKHMGRGQRGRLSNFAATVQILCADTPHSEDTIAQTVTDFYRMHFKLFESLIAPVDGASKLIQGLRDAEYQVVIATNPLYPESAIQQRMAWGNLPVDDEYALITHAENMHFAKPDPSYYAEILGRIGVEPDEAIMVGDSQRNDLDAAAAIGVHTISSVDCTIDELHDKIKQLADNPPILELQPSMIAPQLRGNLGAMYGLLDSIPDDEDDFWHRRPDPNEWSILQILCHLLDAEKTHERTRLETIITDDNPFITAMRPPGPDLPVCSGDGYAVAADFASERYTTIDLLQALNDAAWQRPARHSIFGLTTLLEMAYFTAQHDRLHLNQLCQTIGRCKQENGSSFATF